MLLVVVVVLGLFSRLHADVPQFRSGVALVPVTVTVTDRQGRYITDLRADEFSLSDNGVPARAELFERQRAAVALAIVVDSSSSMSDRLPAVKDAAGGLLQSLRPGDSAAIVDCDSSSTLIAPLSDDRRAVAATLDTVTAGGTTALYDAIVRASTALHELVGSRSPLDQRRVVVLFSDGADTSSSAAVDDVLERVEQEGTVIYSIALGQTEAPGPRGIAALLQHHGAMVLRRFAESTGGRTFAASSNSELRSVYRQLEMELTSQYLLGISPNRTHASQRHRISVSVRRADAVVRARAAYVME
jgi:Ca-activated chloride channel homolog